MSDLEGLKLIPPLQVPPEQFPESGELPEGVNSGLEGHLWFWGGISSECGVCQQGRH